MRALIVGLLAGAAGIAAGCGVTWYEFAGVRESFATAGTATAAESESPHCVVDEGTEHDFGSMQSQATKSHEFVFRNTGTAPLSLMAGEKTCQCVQFNVPAEPIPPGGTAKVFLEWKPKDFSLEFTQSAEVKTNDPSHAAIKLSIRGKVLRIIQAFPEAVAIGAISNSEERETQIRVYSYASDQLEIASHEFLSADTASFFSARWEPLSKSDLEAENLARSGLLLTIAAKPGLPLGAINQTIRLTFAGPDQTTLEIPISGTVAGDISIIGGNYDSALGLLKIGLVEGSKGFKTQLRISIKGAHRHETKLSEPEVDPAESLQAKLGEPTDINGGKAVVYVLTVEIPPGAPAVNRIISEQVKPGIIVINTTHPDAKRLKIAVSFAVQE